MFRVLFFTLLMLPFVSVPAQSQIAGGVAWVQIEARPSAEEAAERARAYADELEDVNGFSLGGGWYAIALGPYSEQDAEQVLRIYRRQGLIPRDSYIARTAAFGERIWPSGNAVTLPSLPEITGAAPVPGTPVVSDTQAPDPAVPDETRAQAQRSERALTAAERRGLQTALKWAGFYNAAIDGSFGRGTRSSMAAWQNARGLEPTGVLTTRQRAELMAQYNAVLADLDMRNVQDLTAGIEIRLPTATVTFEGYEPPFARYRAADGEAATVLLISQPGDRAKMAALFDVMQTLEIVPLEGPRTINRSGFSLTGRNSEIVSETRVRLANGEIKGFTLVWPTGDEERRTRLLSEIEASLTPLPGVMDPATGFESSADLIAGLQVRKPRLSRSGFFVDSAGTVLTTADAVEGCTRITLDDEWEGDARAVDKNRGIAVVRPREKLSPLAVAFFSPASPALQTEVAVAGYPYEGVLDAPSVTFGKLADLRGLRGEAALNRLDVATLPGDSGGPVLDKNGNVFGMLLPPGTDRQLPENVQFALTGAAISDFVSTAGLDITFNIAAQERAPLDIMTTGADMTVLVSCWD